ncbi:MAG: ATP-dependent DNA helicase RecG [Candidatus Levybacteria bacterium]|nr:ATP-dependent DNA helicase RecG [Candidatus Levybacteria bacterium]
MDLHAPIKDVERAFKMYSGRLEKLGIRTPWDFLLHVPSRYEDFSLISKISEVQSGEIVTINGEVLEIKNQYTRRWKTLQKAKVTDHSGEINILWFNQPYLVKNIKEGDKIALSGKVGSDKAGLTMIAPDFELLTDTEPIHTGRLVPIYPQTRGISSKWIRRQVKKILDEIPPNFSDFLPSEIIANEKLLPLKNALLQIHFPKNLDEANKARERLSFDELFLLQLKSKTKREEWEEEVKGIPFEIKKFEKELPSFYKSLPFELTNSQKKAIEEILKDLEGYDPMNRLLQGDVGSGKTVVATVAMYMAFLNGYKSVLMAPTEILAQQHFGVISKFLSPFGINVELATSSNRKLSIVSGKWSILVGTHSVLFKKIEPEKLGLVIIDEQQRFGVEQRSIARLKGNNPHFLTMTATPIPRTVALTIYGDLDLSYLSEMPHGRKIIKTWLVPEVKREGAYRWIEKEIKFNKTQAFTICPFIEESETLISVKAATVEFEKLKKEAFKNLKLKLLHGRIKAKEKAKIMTDFKNKKFDILVATPLVEVGIDIPNATIIVIEAAERFGLSGLHQLRGRVGRSDMQSYCLLFTESQSTKANTRLKGMESLQSGAELAELDLKLRGPGDIYGTAQHGMPKLKVASFSDFSLIERASTQAEKILPKLSKFPALEKELNNINSEQISPD